MKALLLAAGHSKRLEGLIGNLPKAFMKIEGKKIIDNLLEKLEKIEDLNEVYVITNDRFYSQFQEWKNNLKTNLNIEIKSDKTLTNETRLGAIGDIIYSIENFDINDDLMILATDSHFNFELDGFVESFRKEKYDLVLGQKIYDKESLKRFGVAELDENNLIIGMEEKPNNPKSDIAVYAAYIYKKETLPLLYDYKKEGYDLDAPGNFISWLYKRNPTKVYVFEEDFFDVGTKDTYNLLVK